MMIIDDRGLQSFRDNDLSVGNVLGMLRDHGSTLINPSAGVGKSTLADGLVCSPQTYQQYAFVVYLAPKLKIIAERTFVKDPSLVPWPQTILERRPTERCGPLDEDWTVYERNGCGALAKTKLCGSCENNTLENPCSWAKPLPQKVSGSKLIIGTEQRLLYQRLLIFWLIRIFGSDHLGKKPLVILDEGECLDASFTLDIGRHDLRNFIDVFTELHKQKIISQETAGPWLNALDDLLNCSQHNISNLAVALPNLPMTLVPRIQDQGSKMFGQNFKYLGHDIENLKFSNPHERKVDKDGSISYVLRPYLHCDLLILGAHHRQAHVIEKLKIPTLYSPFENHKFIHAETRMWNLKMPDGSAKWFYKNRIRILEFFATLIVRNIIQGKTTVLVSRKKFKDLCARELTLILERHGFPNIKFVTDNYHELGDPDPRTVVVLHYNISGTNDFSDYKTCYSINSYYVRPSVIEKEVTEGRVVPGKCSVGYTAEGYRHVVGLEDELDTAFANACLRRAEVNPAIQAPGRVRPFTNPREISFFGLHDFSSEIGTKVLEFTNLKEARESLGLPTPLEMLDLPNFAHLHNLTQNEGYSIRKAAKELGLNHLKARRLLHKFEGCFTNPIINYYIEKVKHPTNQNGVHL